MRYLWLELVFIIVAVAVLIMHIINLFSYPILLGVYYDLRYVVNYFPYGLVIRAVIVYPIDTQFALLLMILFLIFIAPAIVLSRILSFLVSLGRVKGYRKIAEDWRSIKFSVAKAPKNLRLLVNIVAVIVVVLYPIIIILSYYTFNVSVFENKFLFLLYVVLLILFLMDTVQLLTQIGFCLEKYSK